MERQDDGTLWFVSLLVLAFCVFAMLLWAAEKEKKPERDGICVLSKASQNMSNAATIKSQVVLL